MIVKTIIDDENGRKWEIIKHEADRYSYLIETVSGEGF